MFAYVSRFLFLKFFFNWMFMKPLSLNCIIDSQVELICWLSFFSSVLLKVINFYWMDAPSFCGKQIRRRKKRDFYVFFSLSSFTTIKFLFNYVELCFMMIEIGNDFGWISDFIIASDMQINFELMWDWLGIQISIQEVFL